MKNSYSEDLKKNKNYVKALKIESEQLLKEIEAEKDVNKCIKLVQDYNNLIIKIETEENFISTKANKKPLVPSYQRVERRLSKRCG